MRLRQLRTDSGYTIAEAVEELGLRHLSEGMLQRVEKGRAVLRYIGDLKNLAELYGVDDVEVLDGLIELHKGAASQDWLTQYRGSLKPEMQAYAGIEVEAVTLRLYHPTLVPGILQTEDYAKALFEEVRSIEGWTSASIGAHVEVRKRRKAESILRPDDPVRAWVIVRESALQRPVGDVQLMHEQYAEITALAERENVRIQVLPTAAWTLQFAYNFTILDLGKTLPATVQVDSAWGAISMSDKPSEVTRFGEIFQSMAASAHPPEKTPAIMQRLAREIEQRND
ncbi:hypothetical protein ADK54_02770 [Streptomyces sp. WM6378]|nr:hypothetical protein ADK54_02770 [Streptomyces sp. WM6378]